MPTLIEKGTILPPKGTSVADKISIANTIAKDYIIDRVLKKIEPSNIKHWTDHVLIIVAGTGSGKSVTIPPELYLATKGILGRNVITTQPRTVSAVRTVQEDIVKYYPLIIGKDLGYQTKALVRKPVKGLIYATVGVLLQQMKIMTPEEIMRKYSIIIIDEAHERSIETDLAMSFLHNLLVEYWDHEQCPMVIFMSATIELNRFSAFWGDSKHKPEIITVEGKTYPINEIFLDLPAGNYIWKIIDIVKEIHANPDQLLEDINITDILIFVYGDSPIMKLIDILSSWNDELDDNNKVYPIKFTSQTYKAGDANMRALEEPLKSLLINGKVPKRKIIIATNVAETSLTIETLGYVIDSGMVTSVEFDPIGLTTFVVKNVSLDSAKQRRGRVGRVAPGHWYPVYTEETYNLFKEAKYPDVITTEITQSLLSIIIRDTRVTSGKIMTNLMDVPPIQSIKYSLQKLHLIGAITLDKNDIIPTELGNIIDRFRGIRIENIRMILAGYEFGAPILDLITIAVLSENIKLRGRNYKLRYLSNISNTVSVFGKLSKNEAAIFINDSFIDLIFLFEEFRLIICSQNMSKILKWCNDEDVSYNDMINVVEARDTLISDMIGIVGFNPLYNGLLIDPSKYSLSKMLMDKSTRDIAIDEISKIKNCIYAGYRMSLATLVDNNGVKSYMYNGKNIVTPNHLIGSPVNILFDALLLRNVQGQMKYNIGLFSSLDNYVVHDRYLV